MQRNFDLESITFPEFNRLSRNLHLPEYWEEHFHERNNKKVWLRGYFKFLGDASYPGIDTLTEEIRKDKKFRSIMVWPPQLRITKDKSEKLTLADGEDYFNELKEVEENDDKTVENGGEPKLTQLVIQRTGNKNFRSYIDTKSKFFCDTLSFKKIKGIWRLVRMHINPPNLGDYIISSDLDKSIKKYDIICAVYKD